MPANPEVVFNNQGILPLYDTGRLDNVALPGGVQYLKGQVLGQIAGSGTAVNDVQTITITGTPTGGSFALFYAGRFVTTVAWNSTAAALKTLLEAYFGVGNVTTSGGAFPGTPIVITFQNEAGGIFHPAMTTVDALTGGTTPASANVHTTSGKPAGGYFSAYVDGTNVASRILKYDSATDWLGRVFSGRSIDTNEVNAVKGAPAYFQGHFRCSDLVGLDAAGVADMGKLITGTAYSDTYAVLAMTGAG